MATRRLVSALLVAISTSTFACGDSSGSPAELSSGGSLPATGGMASGSGGSSSPTTGGRPGTGGGPAAGGNWVVPNFSEGPEPGNADGNCPIPAEAQLEDTSNPDQVVGDGNAASCTGAAFIDAVARGGVITFDCGPDPVTITLDAPAKVFNDASDRVVIDGGGLVTLSGGGTTRILYMNTCDEAQHWTTSHCQNQEFPQLTLQNVTFANGNSSADREYEGGGAVWVRGGKVKVLNSRFFNNRCADTGPDLAGAGLYVLSPYNDEPTYVVNSTFGGQDGYGNECSNGGAIGSIGVSWTIINSVMSHNRAVGNGGNPAQSGTPGGGSGGGIYNDGGTMTLTLCGTRIENNQVNAFGSGIFFISNNHDGTLHVEQSIVRNNLGGSWYVLPNISMHEDTRQELIDSVIE